MAAGVPPPGRSRCQGRAVVVVRLDVYNGALATCLLVAETAVSVAREGTGEGGAENTRVKNGRCLGWSQQSGVTKGT